MVILPHNHQAYENVSEAFKVSDRACIIHATGTGKSFVIMAVAGDYQRVLIIAPNNYVLNEIQKRNIHATFATYSAIMGMEYFPKDEYDLIVLDEFHRAGALKWGDGIQKLIEANPHAKMLGTSATEIRYLDNGRDMAYELFENNVVSRITLADAWARGILRVPKYITGLYSFDNVDREYRERIDSSSSSDSEKLEMKDMLDRGRLDWVNSKGIAGILKKHLDKDTKRMIVFCDKIDNLDEQKVKMTEWLQEAGFRCKDYVVHSRNGDSEKQMTEFENDEFDGIKVMCSVNMLNEGVHVPGVDAIVMLRPTQSKTIYLQQMGRCLSAGAAADRQPVVFDFVDNLSSTKEVETLRNEFLEKRAARKEKTPGEIVEVKDFLIEDNLRSLNDVIEIIEGKLQANRPFDKRIQELQEWVIENRRWPSSVSDDSLEKSLYFFVSNHKKDIEIQKLKKLAESVGVKFRKPRSIDKSFEEKCKESRYWIEENKRWPSPVSENPEERSFGRFVDKYRNNQKIKELRSYSETIGADSSKPKSYEERLEELRDWITENKRWPKLNSNDSLEKSLHHFINNHNKFAEIHELRSYAESLGVKFNKPISFEERLEELREWIIKNKRWPSQRNNNVENFYVGFINRYKETPGIQELKKLAENFGVRFNKSQEVWFTDLRDWIEKNKRWPSRESTNPTECALAHASNTHRHTSEIQELKKLAVSFGVKFRKTQEERIEELRSWIEVNKRWPGKRSKDLTESSLYAFGHDHNKDPKIQELKELAASLGAKAPKSSNEGMEILAQSENYVKGGDDAFQDDSQKVSGQNVTPIEEQKVEIYTEDDTPRQNIEKDKIGNREKKEIKPLSEESVPFRRIAEAAVSSGKVKSVGELKDGWALVQANTGQFNFANERGQFMTKSWFDSATDFNNGFATIKRDGCTAKINSEGIAVEVVNNMAQKTGNSPKIR